MTLFASLDEAQPDAILGLAEVFKKDPNPKKINLTAGVYKDSSGNTPVLSSVHKAEERILAKETTKGYLSIEGSPEYAAAVQELLFGADHPVLAAKRSATAHTPGGTGALRVAADFLARKLPGHTVWLSDPTWPNHPSIFQAAGLKTKVYPYFDASANALAWDQMIGTLENVPQGDVILLHGCCHNPTGIDPTPEQWRSIAEICAARDLLPFLDFAYQGFADGLREDAMGLDMLSEMCSEVMIASSYSKNFGLYNERVGALTLIAEDAGAAERALGHIRTSVRANYSNPPAHGAAIVTTILNDAGLRAEWEVELKGMRDRINGMRTLFVDTLRAKGVQQDFSYIARQRGMFSFSGLTPEHVKTLKEKYSIYVVGSGRINVAAITEKNVEPLCTAIAEVLKG